MSEHRHNLTPEVVRRLTVDPHPWLSCDDCFRLVDQYVELVLDEGQLAAERMPAMRTHLSGCAACREEAQTLLALAASDRGLAADEVDEAQRVLTT
jgi:hypothetical protein